jgi:hypothetical protein
VLNGSTAVPAPSTHATPAGCDFPPGEGIIWLASYPKSGNTWTRTFLSNYFREDSDAADINALYGGPIASSRLLFDHAVGIEAVNLLPQEIENLRPGVYQWMRGSAAHVRFVKAHDAWKRTALGEELFPTAVTHTTIYIVRNPLDVAVSAAHHGGQSLELTVMQLCDEGHSLASSRPDSAPQLHQYIGSWTTHVRSWLRNGNHRVHLVRFEDMLRDSGDAFSRMLRFMSVEVDSARLQDAIDASRFEKLQQQERERGFRERRPRSTAPFFRKGKAGSWREELPAELAARVLAVHGETMRELGYLDAAGRPVF